MPLEVLNRAFVFFCCSLAIECTEILSFTRSRIFLTRVQPIFAGCQLSNHAVVVWFRSSL